VAKTTDDLTGAKSQSDQLARRYFTTEGVHPFDEIEWDKRDAIIGSGDKIAFEQRDVEFPKDWSQNATNIVAQKYFRGPMNTPERETSVRQMIGRVVDWYTGNGEKDSYFDDPETTEAFKSELTYLLVRQHMAFNSPVWFNVGLVEIPRVSACFILDVEDDMRSILNWYVEEGLIFKAGSGSGINLSKLRSSKEQLTSGGTASGPVSFMRGADASAGTIKSGGATRRAAKMVVLDVDHPDVEEFINCKVREEDKARALREAGFDMDLDGVDSHSLQYQNANNSVGLSDEFINAYIEDKDWDLKAVKDGRTVKTIKSRDIMRQIAEAAWKCADPGVFYLGTMNQWHTSPSEGPIRATNPCAEFVRPANTSCNLASLRLTQFLDEAGKFDVGAFVAAVETTLTAMDISVTNAEYPTEKIANMVADYRELGIGYTDLGALLMQQGIAYDSDEGRAWAAGITALMGGVAYRRSAEIAQKVGPYPGWTKQGNADAHLKVIEKHRDALSGIDADKLPSSILEAAKASWDEALELGTKHGFRNAQVSLIAPTGTISFLMDADTTGIEPDLALVKMKKLVGGGTMKIVNQSVPRALQKLGYEPQQVSEIIDFISENASVKGAPHLAEEHASVFDCAMGDSPIHYMGHVKMMAAVQPFLSGAISKTVNMPEDASVDEIEELYLEGWKLGLKNLAIYRDNCKVAQPLSAGKKSDQKKPAEVAASAPEPVRRRLPRTRTSKTISFRIADCDGYVHAGEYPDTGELGEIFLKVAKQGSTLSGVMDAFAIALSIGLQYGVPLKAYVDKFTNMRFEPSGVTDDPDFRFASSIVDYIFRRLAADYLSDEDKAASNIKTTAERQAELTGGTEVKPNGTGNGAKHANGDAGAGGEVLEVSAPAPIKHDAPMCYTCGITMQPSGSCYVCGSCGSTSGCS
jgi:ribonucleoside-diphosphate reductase alpha chain